MKVEDVISGWVLSIDMGAGAGLAYVCFSGLIYTGHFVFLPLGVISIFLTYLSGMIAWEVLVDD